MSLNRRIGPALASAMIFFAHLPGAFAGPPLTIDDPGILKPGQWEIIGAATGATSQAVDVYELPLLDVSYGLTANTQLSMSLPYVFANTVDEPSHRHPSNLAVGFKWRFLNQNKLQVAFAPAYAFGIRASAARRGIGDDDGILFLPVNFQYVVGHWTVNGEFGYASVINNADALAYGAAFGHPVGQRTQIMLEVYGGSETDFANDNMNYHIGLDIQLKPRLHWLMSAGSGLWSRDGEQELDFDFFVGIQYFTLGK